MRQKDKAKQARLTAQAAEDMRLCYAFSRAHSKLARWAERTYGDHGPLISGSVRLHFPPHVKDCLRHLARKVTEHSGRSYAAWHNAGRRRATWFRLKEQTIARDGRGFYG